MRISTWERPGIAKSRRDNFGGRTAGRGGRLGARSRSKSRNRRPTWARTPEREAGAVATTKAPEEVKWSRWNLTRSPRRICPTVRRVPDPVSRYGWPGGNTAASSSFSARLSGWATSRSCRS